MSMHCQGVRLDHALLAGSIQSPGRGVENSHIHRDRRSRAARRSPASFDPTYRRENFHTARWPILAREAERGGAFFFSLVGGFAAPTTKFFLTSLNPIIFPGRCKPSQGREHG